jgi:ABC-type transport system involved in multi-copper enzyme maturation permease subunit
MKESVYRIIAIASNTFLEAIRQRIMHILILFGILLISGANFFTHFAFYEQIKFFKDLGHAAISTTGLLIALIGASQLIPAEIERKTIFTIMSKPVRAFEFIFGKYLGLLSLLSVILFLMALMFMAVLLWKGNDLIAQHSFRMDKNFSLTNDQIVEQLKASIRDPQMLQAFFLIWAKLAVVAAISVFLSTFATSTTFIIGLTLMIYLIGHLQNVASEMWTSQPTGINFFQKGFLALIAWMIPNMNNYSVIDEIISGHTVLWSQTGELILYSVCYSFILIILSTLIFESREL